ncbi:MAG: hypothetical protein JJT94_12595 [Bernardetiaceae bacterium]|nr:hypothetical protein [Bernardetiaceae bacterium]
MSSPFKVLESYRKEDADIFFGRERETEWLYERTLQSHLITLYGASGTGKTSLIRCGLSNRFEEGEWLPIYLRRKSDFLSVIVHEANKHLPRRLKPNTPPLIALKAMQLAHFRPIYLIFDQLEEIFIAASQEEQIEFFDFINQVLRADLNCKIILVIREEYLANLSSYEAHVPELFEHRLRLEPMNVKQAKEVLLRSALAFHIDWEERDRTCDMIIMPLQQYDRIELTYLQVYLDKLYNEAFKQNAQHIVFSPALIEKVGALGDVLAEFLDEQVKFVTALLYLSEKQEESLWLMLKSLVSEEGTRLSSSIEEIVKTLCEHDFDQALAYKVIHRLSRARVIHQKEDYLELAHDNLAAKIFDRITTEERMLLRVREFFKIQFNKFIKVQSYLSKKEYDYISPYLDKIPLSEEEKQFVQESKDRLRQKRIWGFVVMGMIIFVLLVAALVAYQQRNIAIDKKDVAELQTQRLNEELKKSKQLSKELDSHLGRLIESERQLDLQGLSADEKSKRIVKLENELKQIIAREDNLRTRANEEEQRRIQARREVQATQRKAKAYEITTQALLTADSNPGYALRLAELAIKVHSDKLTQDAIVRVYQLGMSSFPNQPNVPLRQQITNLLNSGKIAKLSTAQLRNLDVEEFL